MTRPVAPAPDTAPDIPAAILLEAADWLVLLQSGEATVQDHARLERWCQHSPAHAAAWERAQGMLGTFRQVPPKLGHGTLLRPARPRRRQFLLGLAAVPAGLLAWRLLPWQEWRADLATGPGQQQTLTLADGSQLVLNTRSALNVAFTAAERRLTLVAGEILVTTSHQDPSPAPRPFIVGTVHGSMRALGTRFTVRRAQDATHLTVLEGAVEVRPADGGQPAIVRAGEQIGFTAAAAQSVQPVDVASAALWERGLLLARDMRLDELVAELARYHSGVLRCDPAVAGLTVSGAFPVTDTLASLDMLEQSLPVRIGSVTPYWLIVKPR
ncbi:FecR domain-containing protein [Comamonas nitrativorans]|uniref:FecR domain-containing protein n=1 Tax=Comamonas nitrativorans TaxID=108437 RepID=A0ABV9GUJ8_9BURK